MEQYILQIQHLFMSKDKLTYVPSGLYKIKILKMIFLVIC
jgi:hypothetical protein